MIAGPYATILVVHWKGQVLPSYEMISAQPGPSLWLDLCGPQEHGDEQVREVTLRGPDAGAQPI